MLFRSIMGGRSWRELSNMDAMGAYAGKAIYVVSRHDWGKTENTKFITENVIEHITALRNEPGKDIWLFGGGELLSVLLTADLVDEMRIAYIPVILGKGIPLFPDQPKESKWVLLVRVLGVKHMPISIESMSMLSRWQFAI